MADVIFTRASLLDGTNPSQPDSTVVVRGNRIDRVTTASVDPGPDDQVIDLGGHTLMPGMTVGHMHIDSGYAQRHNYMDIYARAEMPPGVLMARAMHNCKALIASGVTGYVGAGCSNDIDAQLRTVINDGLLDGPRIVPGSRFLNSTGHDAAMAKWWYDMQYHPHDIFADGADEFLKATRTEILRGAEIVKVIVTSGHGGTGHGRGLTHDELAAVVRAAHDRGKKVRAHCVWRDAIIECLELGIDVIDHGDELDDRCIDMMLGRQTTWVPSLWFQKLLRNLPPNAPPLPAADADRNWENVSKMLPIANDAGVRIVPGDDYAPLRPGIFGEELSIYVNDIGIKPLDVLRWATVNSGQLTGEATGSVAEGFLADLVVVDGDPSADMSILENADRIKAVMVDGRFVKGDPALGC